MIAIINYGLGNVGAFANIYKRMNISVKIASCEADIDDATHVILPGVGAFDHAMDLLNRSGMRQPLDRLVADAQVPILGVCVGMQMMAKGSDEGESLDLAGSMVMSKASLLIPCFRHCHYLIWDGMTSVQKEV